jgi:hypothetical protein
MEVCDWPLIAVCAPNGCDHLTTLDPHIRLAVEEMAVTWLWEATGRKYGLCQQTVRPCRQPCFSSPGRWWMGPYPIKVGGEWTNCGVCGGGYCSCSRVEEIALPGPVFDIIEVVVDGVALDPSAYRVDNRRWLVRIDGGTWPVCQSVELATTEVGTWAVTYVAGYEVPTGGQVAAGALACQLARLACGQKCDLPANWTNVTRQGVSVSRNVTPSPAMSTGLWLIDGWVESVSRPTVSVRSPDLVPPRVTTWTAPAPDSST